MYLLVLAFTFVNCYCLMILCLHFLSLFTYYIQVPFLNHVNKLFKLPYLFKISFENMIYNSSDDLEEYNYSDEKSEDEDKTINKLDDETEDEDKTINKLDVETEDEDEDKELDNKLATIEDFIKIKKNKFLIDESLD